MVERIIMRNNINYNKKYDKIEESVNDSVEENVEESEKKSVLAIVSIDPSKTLNLREHKSTESEVVKSLHDSDCLEIIDEDEEWYHVCTEGGAFGYVMSKFVKKI